MDRGMCVLEVLEVNIMYGTGNIANAKLQGLEKQLGLKGNQFNVVLTIWFIPYCVCQCLSNLVIKKLRPSRWLPGLAVLWGFVVVMMGLVKNFEQLVVVRFFLGMTEAGLFPGMTFYLTCWYPRNKLQTRISWFFGTASLAGAFSGLVSYGISFMSGVGGLLSWSWLFILEGLVTVVVGFVAFLVMVDFPETAMFITAEERAFIVHTKRMEFANVGEEEQFELRHIRAALTDWQLWVFVLIIWSIGAPLYGFSLFLPTIINNFGYSATTSQLLTIPPYVIATIMVYAWAYFSDKWRKRSPFIYIALICVLIGLAINISDVPSGVKYFGTFWVIGGAVAGIPGVFAWLGNNIAGRYKRGIVIAVHTGFGNIGGIFASNIYHTRDAPRFILGHAMAMMFVGIGFISVTATVTAYRIINRRRDKILQDLLEKQQNLSAETIRKLGDRSPTFRYML